MLGISFKTLVFSSYLLIDLSSRWMGLLSFFAYVGVYCFRNVSMEFHLCLFWNFETHKALAKKF
jgi:hypothetical protein